MESMCVCGECVWRVCVCEYVWMLCVHKCTVQWFKNRVMQTFLNCVLLNQDKYCRNNACTSNQTTEFKM